MREAANTAPTVTPHRLALDGVRGLAIVWVVLHNAGAGSTMPAHGVMRLAGYVMNTGWIGVQLFFALSGYLITARLLDERDTPHYFRDFYVRRALRILPLYYTVLLLILVILPYLGVLSVTRSTAALASVWLFVVNWTGTAPYGFAHFWSLAVEEQFYLVWPFVVWRFMPPRLMSVCLWIALGALGARIALAATGATAWTLYASTLCRMDALALGGAAACLLRSQDDFSPALRQLAGALALLVFLAAIPMTHSFDTTRWEGQTIGYSVLAICSATFVFFAAQPRRNLFTTMLAWLPLRSLGRYSYGIYVVHNLLHKLVGERWLSAHCGMRPPLTVTALYAFGVLAMSYVLGFSSYHCLEKHFLRLKSRFTASTALAQQQMVVPAN